MTNAAVTSTTAVSTWGPSRRRPAGRRHPQLHYRALDDDVVARVRAITISGLAYLVCFAGGHRLGRCARATCRRAYVDTSRNGRRQYCCVRCAHTSAVSRHRRRRSAGPDDPAPATPSSQYRVGPLGIAGRQYASPRGSWTIEQRRCRRANQCATSPRP